MLVPLLAVWAVCGPPAGQSTGRRTAALERALLDRYCVTYHNDKARTANFSLQNLDLATVGDHPESWERVIRKLRAGVMPPPGMTRPPRAEYEELRDWLEAEIDRKAVAHTNPGSVVLHRLNRTEYANAIDELLDLDVDPTTILPPDDSARGFDNIAGSLTISPALLEAYTTAAEEIPFGLPESKHVHYRLMYDLMALAFEGDITRPATFMLGRYLSGATFPESGFNGPWHGSSHHGAEPENIASYAEMNRYHVENPAYFVEKLKKIQDDDTVLDHVLIYKGSNMGNSHRHAHEKVPVILVGRIDGTFKGNRHIVFPDKTQRTSNMRLSILHLFDIDCKSFGSSTAPLALT
jgi:hypothetical protein